MVKLVRRAPLVVRGFFGISASAEAYCEICSPLSQQPSQYPARVTAFSLQKVIGPACRKGKPGHIQTAPYAELPRDTTPNLRPSPSGLYLFLHGHWYSLGVLHPCKQFGMNFFVQLDTSW